MTTATTATTGSNATRTTRLWHPFADMAQVSRDGELVVDRGEGCWVWDEDGRRYLDATAGLWFCNVGYGRTEIADAAAEQMKRMPAYSTFGDFANRPALTLADRLAEIAPVQDSVVFFTSGGSDSVDTAVKLVRHFWIEQGEPQRRTIVTRANAYHGMHAAGTGLAGIAANRDGYGELLTDVVTVPWNDADALADTLDRIGPDRVAAFFCEPVIGAGGVYPPPEGYLAAVRAACRDRNVLFVADEVVTGFGRTGAWFASTRFDLEPDLVLCAKGITSGYLPLGAVIVAPHVAEPFWARQGSMWRHGYTYSGHAVACAAAIPNIDILAEEKLPERALELESRLVTALSPLLDFPVVSEIRGGVGVLAAVQLDPDAQRQHPSLGATAVRSLREQGVLTRLIAGGGLQVSPALVITEEQLAQLTEAIGTALEKATQTA